MFLIAAALAFAGGTVDAGKLSAPLKSSIDGWTRGGRGGAVETNDAFTLTIVPEAGEDVFALASDIEAAGGEVTAIVGLRDGFPRLRVKAIEADGVRALAEISGAKWLETYERPRLFNNVAVSNTLMNVDAVRPGGERSLVLTGSGQVITTSDSGIDTGDLATMHADLAPNVLGFAGVYDGTQYANYIYTYDNTGHGTHTAGSLVGTGECSDGEIKGVACGAKLWAWFCGGKDGYMYIPENYTDLFLAGDYLGSTNAYIHSASWGGSTNEYNSISQAIDSWCWKHPDFLPVFAVGNGGQDNAICCEAVAKNTLAVGATESYRPDKGVYADDPDALAYFSARGPMPDGRIKPDICAPGTYILSTRSSKSTANGWGVYDDNYYYNGGTSMATPLVAGTAALVREWLVDRCGWTNRAPSSALMKAILTGGATRLGESFPNKDFGWGRVNLAGAIAPTNGTSVALRDYIPFGVNIETAVYRFTVTNTAPFDVQLCYVDYPADPEEAEEKALVIDLDLVVSNETTGVVYAPRDRLNNLETVHIDEVAEGDVVSVFVETANDAGYASTDGGAAALYIRGGFAGEVKDDTEYRTLTVSAFGGGDFSDLKPSVGVHRYPVGTEITLSAPEEIYTWSDWWGTASAKFPFICYRAEGLAAKGGFETELAFTLTNDVSVTWYYHEIPTHVKLIVDTYDDCRNQLISPNNGSCLAYWCDYDDPVSVGTGGDVDSHLAQVYFDYDAGGDSRTIAVNTNLCYYNSGTMQWKERRYGTMKLTSIFVSGSSGYGDYLFDGTTNGYRAALGPVTLPMTEMAVVDFGYCDDSLVYSGTTMPYWYWRRNFYLAYYYGYLDRSAVIPSGDADGDGFTNLAEYTGSEWNAGATDEWDENSFPFRFTTMTNFIGGVKSDFTIEYKLDLAEESWRDSGLSISRDGVTNAIDLSSVTYTNFFYRARSGL